MGSGEVASGCEGAMVDEVFHGAGEGLGEAVAGVTGGPVTGAANTASMILREAPAFLSFTISSALGADSIELMLTF